MHNPHTRITQLQQWITEDANDHFSRYALALEYGKIHEIALMRETFEYLLMNAPEYLPTYYHAGSLYEELGNVETAEATFAEGIRQATRQQEAHTLKELKGAHTNLLMEYDIKNTLEDK